jgi:hypothetical protein
MKTLFCGLFLSVAFATSTQAAVVTWTLEDVTFSEGSEVTGTFDYDADINAYSNWYLQTQTGFITGFNYNPGNSAYEDSYSKHLEIYSLYGYPDIDRVILLQFASSLTNGGGTIEVNETRPYCYPTSGSCEVDWVEYNGRHVTGGRVSAVPIPAAVWLFGSALAGLGWFRRKNSLIQFSNICGQPSFNYLGK